MALPSGQLQFHQTEFGNSAELTTHHQEWCHFLFPTQGNSKQIWQFQPGYSFLIRNHGHLPEVFALTDPCQFSPVRQKIIYNFYPNNFQSRSLTGDFFPNGPILLISCKISGLDTLVLSACATESHRFCHHSSLVTGRPSTCHRIRVRIHVMKPVLICLLQKCMHRTWYIMLILTARCNLEKKFPNNPNNTPFPVLLSIDRQCSIGRI